MKTGIYWQDPKYALKPGRDFIFDPSLVLYLPLHKLDGASIMSRDTYGHLCTVTGALWTPQGRSFDGSDDFIDCGNSPVFFPANTLTILAWVYSTNYEKSYAIVISGDDDNAPYQLRTNSTNKKIEFSINSGGNRAIGSTVLTNGEWNFLGGTFDKNLGSQNVKVWVNCEQDGQLGYNTPISTVDTLRIGKRLSDGRHWDGLIGEVWIYSRTLTPQEIQHNYLATKWRYQ